MRALTSFPLGNRSVCRSRCYISPNPERVCPKAAHKRQPFPGNEFVFTGRSAQPFRRRGRSQLRDRGPRFVSLDVVGEDPSTDPNTLRVRAAAYDWGHLRSVADFPTLAASRADLLSRQLWRFRSDVSYQGRTTTTSVLRPGLRARRDSFALCAQEGKEQDARRQVWWAPRDSSPMVPTDWLAIQSGGVGLNASAWRHPQHFARLPSGGPHPQSSSRRCLVSESSGARSKASQSGPGKHDDPS